MIILTTFRSNGRKIMVRPEEIVSMYRKMSKIWEEEYTVVNYKVSGMDRWHGVAEDLETIQQLMAEDEKRKHKEAVCPNCGMKFGMKEA